MQGKPFEFQIPYSSYIMENVLFKISYPAEFHAQTAVEAAHIIHDKLKALGKTAEDIKSVRIRTQEAAVRIIDKQGPLDNFADRECGLQFYFFVFMLKCASTAMLSTTWSRTRSSMVNLRPTASMWIFLLYPPQQANHRKHRRICGRRSHRCSPCQDLLR